ncbi:hypothetical protein PVAND_004133 [Polypedilum vanderplanki]|uniref:Odorant receptor n=1 Tax=Polypedilum vanderplanki TaxID=319348 RepID=A0A9J6BX97_POLVA|nr:hypothetical protein PVAND_004133 [Polypedilum vanderplanki]
MSFQNVEPSFNQSRDQLISFIDFFKCENILQLFGITFLPEYLKNNLKWSKIHRNIAWSGVGIFFLLAQNSVSVYQKDVFNGRKSSLVPMLENSSINGIMTLMFLKSYLLFYRHRVKLTHIIAKLEQHFPQPSLEQYSLHTRKYLKQIEAFRVISIVYNIAQFCHFCSTPFLYKFYGWLISMDVDLKPVYSYIVPFDQHNLFYYVPFNLIGMWIGAVAVFTILATDLFFASIINIVVMEFDNLSQKFSGIDWNDNEGENIGIKKLKSLVVIHNELMDISTELNAIFTLILFSNVFASITGICIYTFLAVSSGVSKYFWFRYSSSIFTMFLQIFTICFYGQRLSESSLNMIEGIYNGVWYKASPKYRKFVLTIMIRSQREMKIRA